MITVEIVHVKVIYGLLGGFLRAYLRLSRFSEKFLTASAFSHRNRENTKFRGVFFCAVGRVD